MRCKHCDSADLFPSGSQQPLIRLILLVFLLHKFRCKDCRRSQIDFLSSFWLRLLLQKYGKIHK